MASLVRPGLRVLAGSAGHCYMTMSLPSRVKRFVAVAASATLGVGGMFFIVFFAFPDTTPPTPFEDFCTYVWVVASWPLSVIWYLSQKDPSLFVIILLTIVSGLFWAFIVELFIRVRRRCALPNA